MQKPANNQYGFTLLELLITIAIVGILASSALPAYARYVSKSQISRVYGEISLYKRAIEDRLSQSDIAGITNSPFTTLSFIDSNLSTVNFGSFIDPANSTITATMDGDTNGGIQNTTITLQRSGNGTWNCTIVGAGGGWSDSLKPSNCL